jgi:hypothetical protein
MCLLSFAESSASHRFLGKETRNDEPGTIEADKSQESHWEDDSSDESEGQGKEHSLKPDLPTPENLRLVGDCYVDGRMDGESLSDPNYLKTARAFRAGLICNWILSWRQMLFRGTCRTSG